MTIEFDNLHTILRSLYSEMMPLCSNMAGVAKGIAGLGALFYVAVRVWQSLARAAASAFCRGILYHVLSDIRPRHDQRGIKPRRAGHEPDARIADDGYE